MLADGLFDQVSFGAVGDETPDVPANWWVTCPHAENARCFRASKAGRTQCPCGPGGELGNPALQRRR